VEVKQDTAETISFRFGLLYLLWYENLHFKLKSFFKNNIKFCKFRKYVTLKSCNNLLYIVYYLKKTILHL